MRPKQQRFVDEYLKDLNATQAAIRAGYSASTAEQIGYQLLQNTSVVTAIETGKAARSERTKIDADWLLKRLAEESTADVNDLYDESGAIRPVSEWPLIWRQGLVAGLETDEERDETGRVIAVVRKVKLSDRVKRLELIGKHIDVQAFREQVASTATMTIVVNEEDAGL